MDSSSKFTDSQIKNTILYFPNIYLSEEKGVRHYLTRVGFFTSLAMISQIRVSSIVGGNQHSSILVAFAMMSDFQNE